MYVALNTTKSLVLRVEDTELKKSCDRLRQGWGEVILSFDWFTV